MRWLVSGMVAAFGAASLVMGSAPVWAASLGSSHISMEATAYGPSAQDNYPYGATDYFGQPLTSGDIAVDPSVIPLKTCVEVTGYSSPILPSGGFIGEADDEGDAIVGHHIDIYLNASAAQVSHFGIQAVHVTVLGPPTNSSLSGTAACQAYAAQMKTTATVGATSHAVHLSPNKPSWWAWL